MHPIEAVDLHNGELQIQALQVETSRPFKTLCAIFTTHLLICQGRERPTNPPIPKEKKPGAISSRSENYGVVEKHTLPTAQASHEELKYEPKTNWNTLG